MLRAHMNLRLATHASSAPDNFEGSMASPGRLLTYVPPVSRSMCLCGEKTSGEQRGPRCRKSTVTTVVILRLNPMAVSRGSPRPVHLNNPY